MPISPLIASLFLAATVGAPQSQADYSANDTAKTEAATEIAADSNAGKIKIGRRYYKPNEEVCKKERVTGTRVKTKTCMSAGQWKRAEQEAEDFANGMKEGVNSIRPDE